VCESLRGENTVATYYVSSIDRNLDLPHKKLEVTKNKNEHRIRSQSSHHSICMSSG
jgi:hypothetical protein